MSTRASPSLDPSIRSIQESLRSLEGQLLPLPGPSLDQTHAAVSMILRGGPDPDILLIKRAETQGDPWSGHMAFPGGKKSDGDRSLQGTAVRETREEVGLDLEAVGTRLGRLRSLSPSTFRLPPISIYPFVFAVPGHTRARVASREVDEILWTPLASFLTPSSRSTATIQVGSQAREFPCFDIRGRTVWGLTYRILTDFLRVIPALPPES